jgi:LuxR family transcriptional regulator, maltose regulon positive regulatory protein
VVAEGVDMQAEVVPLLHSRLMRPPPRRSVPRERLLARLADAEAHLVLLSAPAGFGKTTLLAAWCHALVAADEAAVAWLTLDPGDNDPSRFLAYLHAALEAVAVTSLPRATFPGVTSEDMEPTLTRLLNALEAQEGEVLIVLDDYHVIHAPDVHLAVAFLLNHLSPGVRLVISSRADPPLPLARLRASGRIAELRAVDLRFTSDELALFFAQHGISMPAADLAEVMRWVEGWPAGAQLVALALGAPRAVAQNGAPQLISTTALRAGLAGSQTHLFAYLAQEVFAGQPAHRKTFLLQTAMLDQLCGPLCDAVLGITPEGGCTDSYSRLILDELDQANLFVVPIDATRRWFRYHQLFRAFLRERLERESPEHLADLHRRASAWYAQEGQFSQAITHALAAGELDQAAGLIEAIAGDTIARGEYATLRTWLEPLPEALRDQRPMLWLWTAWIALLSGAVEQIEPALERAAQTWPEAERRQYQGFAAHLHAHLARLRGDAPGTIAAAQQACAALPIDQPALRAGSLLALGAGQLLAGDLPLAEATLNAALSECRIHNRLGALLALRYLGELACQAGHPEIAAAYFEEVLALAGAHQLWEYWEAQAALAGLHEREGDFAGALQLLNTALMHAEQAGVAVYMGAAYLTLARVQVGLGNLEAAAAALLRARRHADRLRAPALVQQLACAASRSGLTGPDHAQARQVSEMLVEPLSERETEVLRAVATGASNQAIAEQLVISVGTVKSHLNHILGKLAAQSRTEAVARARAFGILE